MQARLSLPRRLLSVFREFGPAVGAMYLVSRALASTSNRLGLQPYEFMAQPITDKPLMPAKMMQAFEIREIHGGDPELARMPVPAKVVASRLAQGALCLGAFRKDEFIGYLWLCFERYDEDEVRCTYLLPDDEAAVFDFDFFIYPDHREGLGFLALWEGARRFLRGRGVHYTCSRLTSYNLASRKAHAHLGWRCVGRAVFLQMWRLELMAATIAPYVGVTLRDSGRIPFRLLPSTVFDD